jgi:transcriptional regulator with XRE-family HTH domain
MVARDRDDDFYETVGGRIRKLREDRGWTQEELAQAVAIEPATLSRYENAKKAFPLDVLRRIAASLRIPLGQLIVDGATGGTTKLADAPAYDRHVDPRHVELLDVWRKIPPGRRKLALRLLRALANGED